MAYTTTPLIFVEENLKVNAAVYQELLGLLAGEAKIRDQANPYKLANANGSWAQRWVFQQDNAPGHKAITTQQWIRQHFPDFITKDQWPPSSPDINPIELIWGILKPRVNAAAHPNVASLEEALKREWDALTMEEINNTIDGWPGRLDKMIAAKGGRFE